MQCLHVNVNSIASLLVTTGNLNYNRLPRDNIIFPKFESEYALHQELKAVYEDKPFKGGGRRVREEEG